MILIHQIQTEHQIFTIEIKNTKIKPKQNMHVYNRIQQSEPVALDVHTNPQINAQKQTENFRMSLNKSLNMVPQTLISKQYPKINGSIKQQTMLNDQ